jgi:diacylglycerol kinase (ATP)
MKPAKKFSLQDRARSFLYAFDGMRVLIATQHNARIHLVLAAAALGLGWFLKIGRTEFCLLVFAVALVWIAEAFNTVFEILVNMLSPQIAGKARRAKDIAAAAVVIAAAAALWIGISVLAPPLIQYLHGCSAV